MVFTTEKEGSEELNEFHSFILFILFRGDKNINGHSNLINEKRPAFTPLRLCVSAVNLLQIAHCRAEVYVKRMSGDGECRHRFYTRRFGFGYPRSVIAEVHDFDIEPLLVYSIEYHLFGIEAYRASGVIKYCFGFHFILLLCVC